jgi:hypothetical protein
MKTAIAVLVCVMAVQVRAQGDSGGFNQYVQSQQELRQELWEKKEYSRALTVMKETYAAYLRQDANIQTANAPLPFFPRQIHLQRASKTFTFSQSIVVRSVRDLRH